MSKILRKTGKIIGTGISAWTRVPGAVTPYATDVSLTLQGFSGTGEPVDMLDIMFLFLSLAVVPSLIIMITSFTRTVIVLSFLCNALGTQQSPPSQILVELASFLTLFIMSPVIASVDTQAYQPYREGQTTREQAFEQVQEPMKELVLKWTKEKSLDLFLFISRAQLPDISQGQGGYMKLGFTTVVPSSILDELNKALTTGSLIFIPSLIIDLVAPSTFMSTGMAMLPPTMIALPFKIMMFVLVDGQSLMIKTLIQSFR